MSHWANWTHLWATWVAQLCCCYQKWQTTSAGVFGCWCWWVLTSLSVAVKCCCQWVLLPSVNVSGCWCWMLVLWVLVSSVDVECWCYQEVYLGRGGRCGKTPTLAVGVHVDPQRPKAVAYNVQSPDCQLQETSCTCKHLTQTCRVDWRCKRHRNTGTKQNIHSHCCTHQ